MLKKILSIAMVVTFLFNMTGILVVFRLEQARIRREVKQRIKTGLPAEELHVFDFTGEAYQSLDWEREGREFRQGKELYDVVRSEKHPGGVRLYCINDRQESVLFATLDRLISKKIDQQSGDPHSPVQKALQWFKQLCVNGAPYAPDLVLFREPTRSPASHPDLYTSPFYNPTTPPPDWV